MGSVGSPRRRHIFPLTGSVFTAFFSSAVTQPARRPGAATTSLSLPSLMRKRNAQLNVWIPVHWPHPRKQGTPAATVAADLKIEDTLLASG